MQFSVGYIIHKNTAIFNKYKLSMWNAHGLSFFDV